MDQHFHSHYLAAMGADLSIESAHGTDHHHPSHSSFHHENMFAVLPVHMDYNPQVRKLVYPMYCATQIPTRVWLYLEIL
jgi:hypothetical protein